MTNKELIEALRGDFIVSPRDLKAAAAALERAEALADAVDAVIRETANGNIVSASGDYHESFRPWGTVQEMRAAFRAYRGEGGNG